jgi:putative endonuclease
MFGWLRKKSEIKTEESPLRHYTAQAARQRDGARAEVLACEYLIAKGLTLIDANVACTRGEIDLVMKQGGTLVFVEVRWRKTAAYGGAVASVTPSKLKKLLTACEVFFQHYPTWRTSPCRVDVVALQGSLNQAQIEWLQNVTG